MMCLRNYGYPMFMDVCRDMQCLDGWTCHIRAWGRMHTQCGIWTHAMDACRGDLLTSPLISKGSFLFSALAMKYQPSLWEALGPTGLPRGRGWLSAGMRSRDIQGRYSRMKGAQPSLLELALRGHPRCSAVTSGPQLGRLGL